MAKKSGKREAAVTMAVFNAGLILWGIAGDVVTALETARDLMPYSAGGLAAAFGTEAAKHFRATPEDNYADMA